MIKFWRFKNSLYSNTEADLFLYGEILSEEPWFAEDYIAYKQFVDELRGITADTIHLRINSPGGDVMAAFAIFNQLKESGKKIIAHLDGMCASAATIPMMAASKVIASCNAMLMIHDPLIGLSGYYNADELNDMLEYCEKIKDSIIATYRSRIKDISDEEFSRLMSEETWMTASEAADYGIVDEIAYSQLDDIVDKGKYILVNSVRIDKSKFKSIPVNSHNMSFNNNMQTQKNKNEKGGSEHMEPKNAKEMKSMYSDFCNEIVHEAVMKERNRIKSLDELRNSVSEDMLLDAKYGECVCDAKDLAFKALVASQKAGKDFFNGIQKDAEESGVKDVAPEPQEDKLKDEEKKKKMKGLTNALNRDKRRGQ